MLLLGEVLVVKRYEAGQSWMSAQRTGDRGRKAEPHCTIYNSISNLGAHLLLIMLDQAVRVKSVSHHAVEFEINPNADAVSGHQQSILLHLLFRVVVFGSLIPGDKEGDELAEFCEADGGSLPFIFIFPFFSGFGIELKGKIFDREVHILSRRRGADLA